MDAPRVLQEVQGDFALHERVKRSSRIELADEDTFLRVELRAGKFMLAQSTAGKTWTNVRTRGKDLTLQNKVKEGVFAINATNRPITHEFGDLGLITWR